ncbi:MAG: hypothetical protein HWN67_00135 [Candidatus Helarchaeota archaeon]|nr:hypothetical protein [Candidatus Helarchaeota archaeon]
MHFLNKIIKGQIDDAVHRKFIKFSKGLFMNGGPVLLAKLAKNKILSLNASFDYEDLIGEFTTNHLPDGNYKLNGVIYTQPRVPLTDCEALANSLGLNGNWERGKRDLRNLHLLNINEEKLNSEIKEIYPKLSEFCTLLLNITPISGKAWKFTTKDKIPSLKKLQDTPMPNCKPDKAEKCKYLKFCEKNGICVNSRIGFVKVKTDKLDEKSIKDFNDLFIPDFNGKVQSNFTELVLANQYMIENFEDPPNKDKLTSKELREKIIKKGYINRILLIDKKEIVNKVEFKI